MKIMIAGGWDETDNELLNAAYQVAHFAAIKNHIIITGGGTGIPDFAIRGALDANGMGIAFSNEGYCKTTIEPATFRVATEMGWDGRSVLAVKSSDILIVFGGCNGTLNEITVAYLNGIPIWILRNSSDMICRLENFLYQGKYIDKRWNIGLVFFDTFEEIIDKIRYTIVTSPQTEVTEK